MPWCFRQRPRLGTIPYQSLKRWPKFWKVSKIPIWYECHKTRQRSKPIDILPNPFVTMRRIWPMKSKHRLSVHWQIVAIPLFKFQLGDHQHSFWPLLLTNVFWPGWIYCGVWKRFIMINSLARTKPWRMLTASLLSMDMYTKATIWSIWRPCRLQQKEW